MESDVEETAAEQRAQRGADQSGTGTAAAGHIQATARVPGLAAWHSVAVEEQRCLHLVPAASAMHLVPDIVVEHVSSSSFSDTGTLRLPRFSGGLSALDMLEARCTTGRPLRAVSDSSVYHLERHQLTSVPVPERSVDSGRRATCPLHVSGSLDQFSSTARPELEMEVFTPASSFREPSGSGLKRRGDLPSPLSVRLPIESAYWQPSLASPQSFGPERSPKSNWLRRHSDSNLTSGHSCQTGLRLEPYPIRSRSTGDTLLNVAATAEQPMPSAPDEFIHRVSYEPIPYCRHSGQQRSSPSHLWSVAGKLWQERGSPTVRKFFSEGTRPSSMMLDKSQMPIRSHSENISSRKHSSRFEAFESTVCVEKQDTGHVAMQEMSLPEQATPVSTTVSSQRSEAVDMSTREHTALSQKAEGLVEKRLKLKKYLQTRYQMSQAQLRRSSDTDDVFMERGVSSPLAVSSAAAIREVTEPTDLSVRSHSDPPVKLQSDDVPWRASSVRSSPISEQAAGPTVFHQSPEQSTSVLSVSELPFLVKPEPTSPGIVPSGTSVFIFPPSLPSHHESSEWPLSTCRPLASPVPSPLSSGTSEAYHQLLYSPRFVRYPSSPGEGSHYRAAVLRHALPRASSVSDVPAVYHRAGSLSIATEYSPLMMSEASPSTPPHGLRPTLSEHAPARRSRSGWTQHRFRGRHSSSSSSTGEDLASFMCPVCTVAFNSYRLLTDHMAEHVSSSPPRERGTQGEGEGTGSEGGAGSKAVHLCPMCHRSFSRADMLSRHVRLHTGIRPYECTLCSQVFSRSDHLTTHQRTHTGEKPYHCPVCDYAAPRRDMVTRHTRIHESSSGRRGGARRGRRAGGSASAGGPPPRGAACVSAAVGQRTRSSSSTVLAPRQPWSVSTSDDIRSSTSSSRHWSVASSSMESTDSDVLGLAAGRSGAPGHHRPVTCRAWSTTSADSFESYPGAGHHSSSISSAPADSPDVFAIQPRYFRWRPEPAAGTDPARGPPYPASGDASESSSVAGVMPALQKCSVTSPAVSDQDPTTDIE